MPKKKTHKKRFAAPKFVANATELENRNNEMDAQKAARRGRRIAAGCDDEDLKDDFDATDGDDGFLGVAADMARMKMEQEEALDNNNDQQEKRKGMSTVIETNNPNAKQKSTLSKKDLKDGKFQKKKLTRKEREQFEKEAAERRYWKAMENGTHAQAKKDKKRLEEVKKRREEAKKQREKEATEKEAMNQRALEAAQANNNDKTKDGGADAEKNEILALDKVSIKKMKPAMMKEKLKVLGLSYQGNKKALEKRLLEACGH
eukprot:g8305.t1